MSKVPLSIPSSHLRVSEHHEVLLCETDQKHVIAFCDGNFMCHLDWIVACADIWLHVISGHDCVSPDETGIYINGLSKAFAFPCVGGYHPIHES